jgi:hypothetical protein
MKKSYAKEFKAGPVFKLFRDEFQDFVWSLRMRVTEGVWDEIGTFAERKYALMLMKAITLEARKKK